MIPVGQGLLCTCLSNIDEPDALTLNSRLSWCVGRVRLGSWILGPLGVSVVFIVQKKTQLEDEQWGQMRSYLTHI